MPELICARDLQPGQSIRLNDDRYDTVKSIQFEDGKLIVGGAYNKTATAMRIMTNGGVSFLVHPGQMIKSLR